MKTISVLLSFVQRSVHSAEKILDMTDNVLDAGVLYTSEIKADAAHSCNMSQSERDKEIKGFQKLLASPKK